MGLFLEEGLLLNPMMAQLTYSLPPPHTPLLSSVLSILLDPKILRWCQRLLIPVPTSRGCSGCLPTLPARALPGCGRCRKVWEGNWFYRAANTLKALREKPPPRFPNQVGLELYAPDFYSLHGANLNNFNQQAPCDKLHTAHY